MNAPKLVLYPVVLDTAPEPAGIQSTLEALRLIGPSFELDGRMHFRTGPAFLDHISFLGCSPAIELEPPSHHAMDSARAGLFCHLRLHAVSNQPRVRIQAGRYPRCRHCKADMDIEALHPTQLTCRGCGRVLSPAQLNWRQSGGFARFYLDIWGIHPAEAVPGDQLLDRLAKTTGGRWDFFYIED